MTFWDGTRWVDDRPANAQPRPSSRFRDLLATGMMMLVLAAAILPLTATMAAGAVLELAPGSGQAGQDVTVAGRGFASRTKVVIRWDGASDLASATASGKGTFSVSLRIPAASDGAHQVDAVATGKGKNATSTILASTTFTLTAAPDPTPVPTSVPTSAPTPAPTPVATPVPTPVPTSAPTATPAPTATLAPTPAPTTSPAPTPTPTSAPGGFTLGGAAFQDLDRDGVRDVGEPGLPGHVLEVRTPSGNLRGTTTTDAFGRYAFAGLSTGTYTLAYGNDFWESMRLAWQPTSTGSFVPRVTADVQANATRDFGWRPIVRTALITAPIEIYTGPSGLRVETFSDAVPAQEIYRELMLGLVGPEARFITVRFDLNQSAQTVTSSVGTPGSYTSFAAIIYAGYGFWLDGGDQGLSHEYGHAWSTYYDRMLQQDGAFSAYLAARGLAGDPRIGQAYPWFPDELIAEDYRELFGSSNAKLAWHLNQEIPHPHDVPGLRAWFLEEFTGGGAG